MEFLQDHLLSWIVFLPFGAGLATVALHGLLRSLGRVGLPPRWCGFLGCAASTLPFALCLRLLGEFDATVIGFQFVEHAAWMPALGVNYFVGIDGISLFMLLLTTFLVPVVILATWNEIRGGVPSYLLAILSLETCALGGFASINLVQFYAFWELTSVPLFFLIGIWGGERRLRSASRFVLSSALGSVFLWIAILVLASLQFDQFGRLDFDLVSLDPDARTLLDTVVPVVGEATQANGAAEWQMQAWLFAAFVLAFAIRIPLVPFHTWLPDVQQWAPTAGAALILGVTVKSGIYGLIRYAIPLFPVGAVECTPVLVTLALVGVVGGSIVAMSQNDLRRCVSYVALSQLGLVSLGVFAFNVPGLNGSVLQMLSHGVSMVALVLLVGMLRERRHTGEISEFGGVAKPMPVFAACFGLSVMSTIGLPVLSGFVGEFLILLGVFLVNPVAATVALLGSLLAFAFMLRLIGRLLFGSVTRAENRALIDLGLREKVVMGALALPILGIGIYPEPLLRRIEPSVIEWLQTVGERSAKTAPEVGEQPSSRGLPAPVRVARGHP